ncbi:inositol-3-phosphate synthase [Georgenia sp. Z1491]|uniref:inositol-3-phosphate synthase n=1 Tax=Georgenia sp. Z1491 TaxID=3416707 RepID=UPI003CEA5D7B
MNDRTRSTNHQGAVGAWFIGARGSLATTATVGLRALAHELVEPHGVTTAAGDLADAPFVGFGDIVVGGHDVETTPLATKAAALAAGGLFPRELVDQVAEDLAEIDDELCPVPLAAATQQEAIDAMAADITSFKDRHGLRTVVVVDISSTEALPDDHPAFHSEDDLLEALKSPDGDVLPASAVAAAAAVQAGSPYAGFTPSAALSLPVLRARAELAGVPYAGQDGKTGETLLRTVIAPMFAARNLKVLSWAGTNILGGGDGATLADPRAVSSKLASKNRGLHALVGDDVHTPLHIDNVPDMGNVKTAWDHVHAVGFLGSRITLQTTWSAHDSALAAPLVIDLVRSLALASDAGVAGAVTELGCFFKDPWGSDVHAFAEQTRRFAAWVEQTSLFAATGARGAAPGHEGTHDDAGTPAADTRVSAGR